MSRVAQGDGPRGEHPAPHSEGCQPPIQRRLEIVAGFTSESVTGLARNTQDDVPNSRSGRGRRSNNRGGGEMLAGLPSLSTMRLRPETRCT